MPSMRVEIELRHGLRFVGRAQSSLSVVVAAALLVAGCSSDSVTAGAACEDSDCELFFVRCEDGAAALFGGCSGNACLSQEQATEDACPGSDVESVIAIAAGAEIPELDAGTSTSSKSDASTGTTVGFDHSCLDNVQYLSGFNNMIAGQDCTLSATVCEEDEAADTTVCRPPLPGDLCYAEGTFGCTEDGGTVVCKSGTFEDTNFECAAPSSCVTPGHRYAACLGDEIEVFTLAGGPCDTEGSASCSFDRGKVNRCDAGTWTTTTHCGLAPCKRQKRVNETDYSTEVDHYYSCSNGGATLGDLCTTEGSAKCTTDLTEVLSCVSGTLQAFRTCGVGEQCGRVIKNGEQLLGCRSSSYTAGEPCHFPHGTRVCTADGSQILSCDSGTMALLETCEAATTCQPSEELGLPTVKCL